TLEVDLGENAPNSIKVLMSEADINDYTYENVILTIPNVSGDIEIQKVFEPVNLVEYITNLHSPNSTVTNNSITYKVDTTNGIIDDGLGGTVSNGGNLRYYGASPNNYIDIGDRDSSGNIILWRIIGVFETKYATDELPCNTDSDSDGHYDNCESEKLVKIIRNESIGEYSWDVKPISTTTSSNVNIFKATPMSRGPLIATPDLEEQDNPFTSENNWSDATLKTLLNETYYNSSTTSYYNSSATAITVDLTGEGLSEVARNKVENALWNLGGPTSYTSLYSDGFYSIERGTTVDSGNPTEWVGKIGLMYSSDYGYATDLGSCSKTLSDYNNSTCYTNDWLYNSDFQWTMSPRSSNSDSVFIVYSVGDVYGGSYNALSSSGVRPVLYLKSDVSIVGEGTTSEGINYYVVD
ncbi:MAG: hypothetical protein IJY25_06215, partial [Bacilli bacterium]|nr:hypothetical protein [Bacilli bacterium]